MNTLSNIINVDTQTYRYISENRSRPWGVSNSYSKENYFGDKRISYNVCLIPIGSFNFNGTSTKLELKAYVYKPSNEFPKFCWAICTSDKNKKMYENAHGEVKDDTQIVWGTAELNKLYYAWQIFEFESDAIPSNTQLYVYFWPYSTGGVAHIDGNITATLYYKEKEQKIKEIEENFEVEPDPIAEELIKQRSFIRASKQVKYNENIETKRSI